MRSLTAKFEKLTDNHFFLMKICDHFDYEQSGQSQSQKEHLRLTCSQLPFYSCHTKIKLNIFQELIR